jgi:capsular exopolysaccharide synthesis family protein
LTAHVPAVEPAPSRVFAELSLDELGDGLERKVVVDRDMLPASREQYRRLAATLHQAQSTTGLKVVMVVSAVANEGKTLTAANLALTFSESYRRRVLLIDGDLRRPSLDTLFRIDASPGLNEGLTSPMEQMLPLRPITPRLMVLPGGQPSPDPIAALTSDRMRRLIDEARGSFDWVVIDTPPVGILPDANLVASMADGAVLVVRAEATPYDLVQRAVESLGHDRILGVVLNRASEVQNSYYSYSRYYAPRADSVARR